MHTIRLTYTFAQCLIRTADFRAESINAAKRKLRKRLGRKVSNIMAEIVA